jgi:hypothetical protein
MWLSLGCTGRPHRSSPYLPCPANRLDPAVSAASLPLTAACVLHIEHSSNVVPTKVEVLRQHEATTKNTTATFGKRYLIGPAGHAPCAVVKQPMPIITRGPAANWRASASTPTTPITGGRSVGPAISATRPIPPHHPRTCTEADHHPRQKQPRPALHHPRSHPPPRNCPGRHSGATPPGSPPGQKDGHPAPPRTVGFRVPPGGKMG